MRKIFIKYFLIIMVLTVLVAVVANSVIQTRFAKKDALQYGETLIHDIASKIADNNKVIESLVLNLNENYIARAKAFAEIIAQSPDILPDFDEMERIADVLNVDEVHVTDDQGVLRWGNIKAYYGLDFKKTDQTRPFMPALTDKNFEMAQEPQPNGSEGKLFQYISVARQDKSGIVQVGVTPEILDNALKNNKIKVIIEDFNVGAGEYVVAIDKESKTVVGDTKGQYVGKSYEELGIVDESINLQQKSQEILLEGENRYTVFGEVEPYIIAVGFSKTRLYTSRDSQNLVAVISSTLLGFIIIISIFFLLKRIIIQDVDRINNCLKNITHGELEVLVEAKSTPEFVFLSHGINEMVGSLKKQMREIIQQTAILRKQAMELEENNKNIMASLSYARKIQGNLLPSVEAFDSVFSDYHILWEPRDAVGGDIYWIRNYGKEALLCVCDCTGHGTPGALLTMLVVTALDSIVTKNNYQDTAQIIWELEQKLIAMLNVSETGEATNIKDGADLAVLHIDASGNIAASSANIHIFVCDGEKVEKMKGQKLRIGEGNLKDKNDVAVFHITADAKNKYYIASDGLFDQVGGNKTVPFGYRIFKKVIMEYHNESQGVITEKIWEEFKRYMGMENRRDDITLVSFKP